MGKVNLIAVLVLVATLIVAGCVSEQKAEGQKNTTAKNETPAVAKVPVPNESNKSVEEKVVSPAPAEKEPVEKVIEYLSAHPVDVFKDIDKRLIEVEFDGTRSVLRFRTSTPNPRQESIYLLGVQFLVFPDIGQANATGYNQDGEIIMNPDSRTQEKRSTYWKKYRTQTDWFPNLTLTPECKVDTDCNDNNDCTQDVCVSDGFCSNPKIIKAGCS